MSTQNGNMQSSHQETLLQCTIPFGTKEKICEFIGNTSEMGYHRSREMHSVFECMQCREKFCLKEDVKNHQLKWTDCYRGQWTAWFVTSVDGIDNYPAVKELYMQKYEGPRAIWRGPVDERDNKPWQKKSGEMDFNSSRDNGMRTENTYPASKRKVLLPTPPALPQVSQASPTPQTTDVAPEALQAPPLSLDDAMEISPEQPDNYEMSPEYDPGTYDPIPESPTYDSPMDIVVSPAPTHEDARDDLPPIASSQLYTPSRSSSPESVKKDSAPSSSPPKKTGVMNKPISKRQVDMPPAKKPRQEVDRTDILGSIMKSITRTQSTEKPIAMKKTYEQKEPKNLPRPICPSEKMLKRSISNSSAFASMNLSDARETPSTSCASRCQNMERQTPLTGPSTLTTPPTPAPTMQVTSKELSPAPGSNLTLDIASSPNTSESPISPSKKLTSRLELPQSTNGDQTPSTSSSSQKSAAPSKKLKRRKLPPLDMSRRAYRTGEPVPYESGSDESDDEEYITLSD